MQREQSAHHLSAVTAAVLLGRRYEIDDDRQPGRPQRVAVATEPQRGDATAAVVANARDTPPRQLERVGDGGTCGETLSIAIRSISTSSACSPSITIGTPSRVPTGPRHARPRN